MTIVHGLAAVLVTLSFPPTQQNLVPRAIILRRIVALLRPVLVLLVESGREHVAQRGVLRDIDRKVALLVARVGCAAGAALYVAAFVAVWALLSSPLARLLCWPCIEPPVARVCCVKDALAGDDAAAEAPAPSERALQ